MKKIYILCLIIFGLFFSRISIAQKSKTQLDEAKETTTAFVKAESVKALEDNLVKALGAEHNSGAVTAAMKKFWESAKGLDQQQAKALFQRFSNASKTSLKKLASLSPRQLTSYAREVTSHVKIDANTLKRIICGAGDKAGNTALRTLYEMDNMIAETGKVSQELLRRMRDEAGSLDPKRARALYDLFKKDVANIKNLKDTKNGLGKYVGTVVDGVFVLNDAVNIYYSDDEPEVKAINATGKIIDYGTSTAAGAGTAALGAGELAFSAGLGVGLTIAFSANRVSTLYTEIAMLQKEKEAAKNAEKNEKIDNEILIRRQLVNINGKIKAGKIDNAQFLLVKLQKFILNNRIDNEKKLLALRDELEDKANHAERNQLINEIINKANHPYTKASNYYRRGVELNDAKIFAAEALNILKSNVKKYPEIAGLTAISKTEQLIKAINEKIASATDLSISGTNLPKRVYAGQSIEIKVFVKGGIPYYRAKGNILGNISDDDVVTMYWEAPSEPGIEHLTFKIRDCMGNIAAISGSTEVVEGIGEEDKEPVDVEYSDLKEFVNVNRDGTPYIFYSANKYHIGYSSEYANKTMYEDKENNEGFWVTGSSERGRNKKIWYCLPHGPYRRYDIKDGKTLEETGFYNKGKKHGKWTHYAVSGPRKGQVEYFTNYKNGLKNGIETFYNSKGDISSTNNYRDDKKHGTQISYSSKIPGGIESEREYKNGELVSGYTWSPRVINGKIVSWIKYTNYSNGTSKEERYDENFKLFSSRLNDINGNKIKNK